MGRRRLTRPVQSREFCRADLLGAGGPGQPAAVLGPAVFTRAAGRGQEALGHAEALRRKGSGLLLPIHSTSACRRATVRSAAAAASSHSRCRYNRRLLRCPPGRPREPHSHPAQPPPVYNDWDRTGRAGPARTRTPSSRRSRLPGSSDPWP